MHTTDRQTGRANGGRANGIDDANTPESKYSISPICSMCSISSMCSIRSMCCARLLELGPYYSLCYLITHTNTTRTLYCAHDVNRAHIRAITRTAITHITLAFDCYTIYTFFMFWPLLASLRTFIHYIHAHILRTHTPLTHNATSGVIRNTPSSLPHKNPCTRATKRRVFFRRFAVTSFLQPTRLEPTT